MKIEPAGMNTLVTLALILVNPSWWDFLHQIELSFTVPLADEDHAQDKDESCSRENSDSKLLIAMFHLFTHLDKQDTDFISE